MKLILTNPRFHKSTAWAWFGTGLLLFALVPPWGEENTRLGIK